jgi:hypothetical protein
MLTRIKQYVPTNALILTICLATWAVNSYDSRVMTIVYPSIMSVIGLYKALRPSGWRTGTATTDGRRRRSPRDPSSSKYWLAYWFVFWVVKCAEVCVDTLAATVNVAADVTAKVVSDANVRHNNRYNF